MGGTGSRKMTDSIDEGGQSHRDRSGEPAGDREPLEDGAVSDARDACLESSESFPSERA